MSDDQGQDVLTHIAIRLLFEIPPEPGNRYIYEGHTFARHHDRPRAWSVRNSGDELVDVFYPSRFASLLQLEQYVRRVVSLEGRTAPEDVDSPEVGFE